MEFPKQIKDIVYNLLQEPTLDNFREFLKGQTGECDAIDFKGQWIEKSKLAKEILAIANVGGGIIFFGVIENEDKTFSYEGLSSIKNKADIYNQIKNIIPSELKHDIYDFVYESSEYDKLNNHKYQMLVIDSDPKYLPYMAVKDSDGLKKNRIYVRRGTSIEEATKEKITELINKKINAVYPDAGKTLGLREHLEQLQCLYDFISPDKSYYEGGVLYTLSAFAGSIEQNLQGRWVSEENPLYPEENFEQFISRMIEVKKKKIERVLDLG